MNVLTFFQRKATKRKLVRQPLTETDIVLRLKEKDNVIRRIHVHQKTNFRTKLGTFASVIEQLKKALKHKRENVI